MSQQTINIGTTANDHTGDPLRTAFTKINANFTELYAGGANESQLTNGAYTVTLGSTGNLTLPNSTALSSYGGGITTGITVTTPSGSALSWSSDGLILNSKGTISTYNTTDSLGTGDRLKLQTTDNGAILLSTSNAGTPNSWYFTKDGKLIFPNSYTFDGQILTDISGTTNYSLKIANGTTGSVFAVGTGTDAYGVANDALDHTQTTYVPYNATASAISFNIPGKLGSLTINASGVVTVPNGLVIPTGTKASNATGTVGQITYDASYIYICTATNTWKRSPLTGGY